MELLERESQLEALDGWLREAVAGHGRLVLVGGDDETELRAALAAFQRLGARPMVAWTVRRLCELGVRAVPRGPRPTTHANPANLTDREVEVLGMIVAGCRNGEIADSLFLSPKTVEHHIGSVLAKLGAGTRQDAIAAARRRGVPPADGGKARR